LAPYAQAMNSFARAEREALCDLALKIGDDAPTLCGEWSVKDLVVHLLVRERSLVGSPGILVPALSGATKKVSERYARADLALLVDQLRKPRITWAAVGPVDALVNTVEFFVHHEDIRRAQPGWKPRTLTAGQERMLWRIASMNGRGLVRPAGVPVVIERADDGSNAVLRRGADPVVIRGLPSEIVLFLYGRDQLGDLEFSGPAERIAKLKQAKLGI
jgi:uncharacterized protein (TIGR03085 family)